MALPYTNRPGVYTAKDYAAITPSDTVNFTKGPCTSIWVGGGGIVQVVRWDDVVVPFTANGGTVLPVMAKRVNTTDTTATLMVALY